MNVNTEIYVLGKNGRYERKGVFGTEDYVSLLYFDDLKIDIADLFRDFPIS